MKKAQLAFVHGWGIGSFCWQDCLAELPDNIQYHLVDLPGYGTSPKVDNTEAATLALINKVPAGSILCGWSLGSMIATLACLMKPEHFAGLILVGSTPSFIKRENWPYAQAESVLDSFVEAISHNPEKGLQRFIALLNQGDEASKMLSKSMMQGMSEQAPIAESVLLQGLSWLKELDLRECIAKITLPTLIIHGAHDPLMPVIAAKWLKDHCPQAQLSIYEEAAHAPFLSQPVCFARQVGQFCHEFTRC